MHIGKKVFIGIIVTNTLIVLLGFVISDYCRLFVFKSFDMEITMAEDLIFDDQTIVDLYGEPIKLSKGMSGRIVDVIDSHGDTIGYDYINVHFKVKDGKTISAAISFDRKMDSSVLVLKEGILDIRPVFDISKIEYPQTVLSEYKLSRERYFTTIRMIRIIVVSISVVIAMGLSFAYFKCFKYKTNNKKV